MNINGINFMNINGINFTREDVIDRTAGNLVTAGIITRNETDFTKKNLSVLGNSDLVATMVESHNLREDAIEQGYAVKSLVDIRD